MPLVCDMLNYSVFLKLQIIFFLLFSFICLGHTCTATLMESISMFSLSESESISLINLEKLKDYTPYPVYHWRLQPVIVLKHLYREM